MQEIKETITPSLIQLSQDESPLRNAVISADRENFETDSDIKSLLKNAPYEYVIKKADFLEKFFSCKEVNKYIITFAKLYISEENEETSSVFLREIADKNMIHKTLLSFIDLYETKKNFDSNAIKSFCKEYALPIFYAKIIKLIKDSLEASHSNNSPVETLRELANITKQYYNVIKIRNFIIKNQQSVIDLIINTKYQYVSESTKNDIRSISQQGFINGIFLYTPERCLNFYNYIKNKIILHLKDNFRKEHGALKQLQRYQQKEKKILSEIQKTSTPTSQQLNLLLRSQVHLREYKKSFDATNPQKSIYEKLTDTDNNDDFDISDTIRDREANERLNATKKIDNLLQFLYAKELYAVKITYDFYKLDKNTKKDLEENLLKLSANQEKSSALKKLKLISKSKKYQITDEEKFVIKAKFLRFLIDHKAFNKYFLVAMHFGLIDGCEYSRHQLCDITKLNLNEIDNQIIEFLKHFFHSYKLEKLYSLSLAIEKQAKTPNLLQHINNFKSTLSQQELAFFMYRYDFISYTTRPIENAEKIFKISLKKLIKLEMGIVNKLKILEPKLYEKILRMHKESIKRNVIRKNFALNSLFMLTPLQAEILKFKKGITRKKYLCTKSFTNKFQIDRQTYYREYKNAEKIINKYYPLNLRSRFLKRSYLHTHNKEEYQKIFRLKFIKLLSPKQIAKKLNLSIIQYLLKEHKLTMINTVYSCSNHAKRKHKLLKIYRKCILARKNLTYKEKLENSIFILKNKRMIQIMCYSFGLFGLKAIGPKKIAAILGTQPSYVVIRRNKALKILKKYLNFPSLHKLCKFSESCVSKSLTLRLVKNIENEIYRMLKDISPLDREIFYRNFGLKYHNKESYYTISKSLKISENYILESLMNTCKRINDSFPKTLFHQFLCNHISTQNFNINNSIELANEIKRYLPIFTNLEQQILIHAFGFFNNKIISANEAIKKLNINRSRYFQIRHKTLETLSAILKINLVKDKEFLKIIQDYTDIIKYEPLNGEKFFKGILDLQDENKNFLLFRYCETDGIKTLQEFATKYNKSLSDVYLLELKSISLISDKLHFNEEFVLGLAKLLQPLVDKYKRNEISIYELVENFIFILPKKERDVMILRLGLFGEEMLKKESVCEKLGIGSINTVQACVTRAIEKLSIFLPKDELLKITKRRSKI